MSSPDADHFGGLLAGDAEAKEEYMAKGFMHEALNGQQRLETTHTL